MDCLTTSILIPQFSCIIRFNCQKGAKRGVLQSIFGKKNQIQQIVSAKQESKRENAAVMIQKRTIPFSIFVKIVKTNDFVLVAQMSEALSSAVNTTLYWNGADQVANCH